MNINPKKPLLELTVEEFLELQELNALEKKGTWLLFSDRLKLEY